jgi:glycerol-3-phosphate dehydrogenase
VTLPGGDFPVDGVRRSRRGLRADYPFLSRPLGAAPGARLRHRGAGDPGRCDAAADLGRDFGATLTEAEVRWLMAREYARTAEDVVWRRSKLGLRLTEIRSPRIDAFMEGARPAEAAE